jgi:phosphoribosylformylglycinamidine synthase
MGASEFYDFLGQLGANIPTVDFERAKREIWAVIDCIDSGLIAACHDISEGGLLVTLAEMTMPHRRIDGSGKLGVKVDISQTGPADVPVWVKAFGESGGFVCEVGQQKVAGFMGICANLGLKPIELGEVTESPEFTVSDSSSIIVNQPLSVLQDAWLNSLAAKLK